MTQLIEMVNESEKAILPPKRKKSSLEENANTGDTKTGLFVGCNIDYDPILIPIPTTAAKLLAELGVNLAIPAEQVCCGQPLAQVGGHKQLRDLVVKNVEAFKKAGCMHVLTLCSG